VGSNSVVVKDVPAEATVVGIPAHIVTKRHDEKAEQRKKIADKIGFTAYAQAAESADPVAQAVDRILEHLHAVDERINYIDTRMSDAGMMSDIEELPELEVEKLDPAEEKGGDNT
jgi:serine O-acetyltransferase